MAGRAVWWWFVDGMSCGLLFGGVTANDGMKGQLVAHSELEWGDVVGAWLWLVLWSLWL